MYITTTICTWLVGKKNRLQLNALLEIFGVCRITDITHLYAAIPCKVFIHTRESVGVQIIVHILQLSYSKIVLYSRDHA